MSQILFVYNADAGFWNAVLDSLHKTFRPNTYPCSLCAITYGIRKMRPQWKVFLEEEFKNVDYSFLHKDEFIAEFGLEELQKHSLPAIFRMITVDPPALETILHAEEMNSLNLDQLIVLLRERVLIAKI